MTGKSPTRRPKLRWWQRLCRAGVALAIFLAGACFTFPWWAPTGYIARQLCRQLSAQSGCDVTIGELKLSWWRGVEIHNFAVAKPAGGVEPLASVRTIRAELSPVQILVHDDLGTVQLIEPTINLAIDANGQTDLGPLLKLRGDAEPSGLHVERATVRLHLPDEPRPNALYLAGMEVDLRSGGQVAMAGELDQDANAGVAPLSLSAQASPGGGASASVTFTNLDLAGLPISGRTHPPLRKLAGRADGVLDVRLSSQGIVDSLDFKLRIRKLDAQPVADVQLPVIDEALLDVSATYDQITNALRVQTAHVRLPGLADLLCQADVDAGLLGGQWEAIESLTITGQVQPAQLAAMLTGRRRLPGDLDVTGPVNVSIRARKQGKLRVRMSADATGAEIRQQDRVLKPAGRKWDMGFEGELDYHTTDFDVGESWLRIATNQFTGYGALLSLSRLAGRLSDPNATDVGQTLVSALATLDWRGEWGINDLPALLDLAPRGDLPDLLGQIKAAAPLTGRWFIHHGPATQLHASLHAAGDAKFALGKLFIQPAGVPLDLGLGLAIEPNSNRLTDLTADLAAGPARLGIEGIEIALPDGDKGSLRLDGRYSAERIEQLLACLPDAAGLRGIIDGSVSGRMTVEAGTRLRKLSIEADLKDTHVCAGKWFCKQPGQEGRLTADLLPGRDGADLSGQWTTPSADVGFRLLYASADANAPIPVPGDANAIALAVDAHVKDASRLPRICPALADLLAGGSLGGTARLTAIARRNGKSFSVQADCDATNLSLASPAGAAVKRNKPAGVPLTISLAADANTAGDILTANARRLDVHCAASHAVATGWASWPGRMPERGSLPLPERFDIDANASLVLSDALRSLTPELDMLLARYGLTGRCSLDMSANADPNGARMNASLDATGLAVDCRLPAAIGDANASRWPAAFRTIRKSAASPATVKLDLSCPHDLGRVRVHNLLVRADQTQFVGGGTVILPDANTPRARPKVDLHASLSTRNAETLSQLLPGLKNYGLAGNVLLDVSAGDIAAGMIDRVILTLGKCRGHVAGKDLFGDGTCIIDGLDISALLRKKPTKAQSQPDEPTIPVRIRRVRSGGLEFRAGTSHGWVVADVSDFPAAPKGKVNVLTQRLDAHELSAWLEPADAPKSDPNRPWKLTPTQHTKIEAETRRLASLMAKVLANADLTVHFSADEFRTFDKSVMLAYDLRCVDFDAAVRDGKFKLSYTAGLNGGRLRDVASGDLTDPNATVKCESIVDGVLAEDNIKPQLAKFFPGNTILGTFSKRETATAPLFDLLAMNIDARWPVIRTGENKTVAVEGFTQGRAAPKFITNLFPGLNLTKYRYDKMTAFAVMKPDGTVYNDMVFGGKSYDLYMEGTTDANGIAVYEIGLILLGTPQSAEWNHTYRQGRVPLLNFQARIEGGKMHDVEVSYLWPNETLFTIFLKNNIFYRIWLASGKNKN